MPHRHILSAAPPATDSLLHRGDSGADIVSHELGQRLESRFTSEYPTIFHIYSSCQPGESTAIQAQLYAAARANLLAMKCPPPAHDPATHVHTKGPSAIKKCWNSLTGRGDAHHSDSHVAVVCAPHLWQKSIAELFSEANGQLETCEYLPQSLSSVVTLPRYLNAIMQMLLKKQALESHGIFRLAAANDVAAMNRWFDWIEPGSNNNVPEYGAIPNLSPLDFAVVLKRWMSSLGDEDRLVPTVCSRAIHTLMDQYDPEPELQQHFKDALRCILQCLDPQRLSVLACILHIAQAVIAKSTQNAMDGGNLAKMLAPSMFAFGQVRTTNTYDWAIRALTVIFAEKDIGWWFQPISYEPFAQVLAK